MDFKILLLIITTDMLMVESTGASGSLLATGPTDACYLGRGYWRGACYKAFKSREHWARAQELCEQNDGNLFEFLRRDEEDFVLTLMSPTADYWIGLHMEVNGKWRWRSGSDVKLPYFSSFAGTSVSGLKSSKCGALSTSYNGSLNTHDCQDDLLFICKTKPFDCSAHFDWHVSRSQHCLWFSDSTNTGSWPNIRLDCHNFNSASDLATFSTSKDASLLPTILRHNVSYWVGLRNAPTTLDLIWLDGVKETSSSRFSVVTRGNRSTSDIQCGCVTLTSRDTLQWELDDCQTHKQFICERTAPKPLTTSTTQTTLPPTASNQTTPDKLQTTKHDYPTTNAVQSQASVTTDPVTAKSSTITTSVKFSRVTRNTSTALNDDTVTLHDSHTTSTKTSPGYYDYQYWFTRHLPKRHLAHAALRFRRSHKGWIWHNWHARTTISPYMDCCFQRNSIICKHNASYFSALSSFRPCEKTSTVDGALSTTAAANAHLSKSVPIPSPVPTESSTDKSPVHLTLTGGPIETAITVSPDDTSTTDVTSGGSGYDNPDSELFTSLNNVSSVRSQLQKVCPGSDHPFSCLMNHIKTGDLRPEVMRKTLHDLQRSLLNFRTFQQPTSSNILFENFFRMVNFFIEGSYSQNWQKYNLSLCDVISIVEPFLDSNIRHLGPSEAIVKTFSHVEILIKRMKRDVLKSFRFDDHYGIGHIDSLTTSSTTQEDLAVAIVFMKVPVLQVALDSSNYTGLVVSPILSLSAYTQGKQLSLTHDFTLKQTRTGIKRFPLTVNETDTSLITCAYWNNATRVWSTYGCSMTLREDMTSHCHCNHTTSFAILMQVNHFELSGTDKFALEVITYIGCSVALITQVIAITVFTFVGTLNSERVFVHRNLCIAIVGAQVTFLAGIDAVDNRLVCAVVALVLHYCYTAVFIWMLVEGLHLYSKVVQVFGTERSRIIYYMTFGWGVPVVLVTISAAADWEGYGTDHSCWLSTTRRTIWAFVGPALAIVIVNLVILAIVVRIVMSSTKKPGEYDHIRAGIKGALFLLPLLGLTWVFGLAAVNKNLVVFQYLFAIFNSLQGFFIFLFHCAFNSEVRQALRRLKEKRSLQKGDLSVSSGSHGVTIPLADAWAAARCDRNYPPYQSNQVAPLATTATTTTRLGSLSHSKESDDAECPYNMTVKEENEELSLMYI